MDEALHHKVSERAHQIWEREGRPVGVAHLHWDQALQEILAEEGKDTPVDNDKASSPAGEHVYGSGDATLAQRTVDGTRR